MRHADEEAGTIGACTDTPILPDSLELVFPKEERRGMLKHAPCGWKIFGRFERFVFDYLRTQIIRIIRIGMLKHSPCGWKAFGKFERLVFVFICEHETLVRQSQWGGIALLISNLNQGLQILISIGPWSNNKRGIANFYQYNLVDDAKEK